MGFVTGNKALGRKVFDRVSAGALQLALVASLYAALNLAAAGVVDVQINAGSDDAEEAAGVVDLVSSDLELTVDGTKHQTVGMRFTNVTVPGGETIASAYVQFTADEAASASTTLTIKGQLAANPVTFNVAAANISSRPRTIAGITWTPAPWNTVGAAGVDQQTPDISAVIQEIIDQPGWVAGNAIVLVVTGDNAGKRVAESFNGDSAAAPRLHVEFGAATGNQPPQVEAGSNRRLVLSDSGSCPLPADTVCLEGTAADDGIPGPLTTDWVVQSGPNTAVIANPTALSSTAFFPEPGIYSVALQANDGQLSGSDTLTVTVARTIKVPGDAATIQAGVDLAADGDLVLVAPGVYQESVNIANKTITLASHYYLNGDPAMIDATEINGGGAEYTVRFDSSVGPASTVTGFHVRNSNDGIIGFAPVNILYNHVTETFDALEFKTNSGGLARGNLLELNSDDGIDLNRDTSLVAEQNMIRNNQGDGVEMRMNDYSGPPLTVIFRNNVIHDNENDGIQLIDYDGYSPRSIYIQQNLIYDNAEAGVGIMGGGETHESYEGASALEAVYVQNNTFVGNNHGLTGGDNLIAVNNIFAGHVNIAIKNTDGNSSATHNLFWNNGSDIENSNVNLATTVFANPLLDSNYYPTAGSPAINAGTNAGFPFNGAAPDLGAYETPVNASPVVQAGEDVRLVWSSKPLALNGSVSDDALPPVPGAVAVKWTQVSGACGVVFADDSAAQTTVTFAEPGAYILRLTASDGVSTTVDDVSVCTESCHP